MSLNLHRLVSKGGNFICKHFPGIRWQARTAYWSYKEGQYKATSARTAVEKKTVFFESFGGRRYGDSPKTIYEAMLNDSSFEDWTFYWSFSEEALPSQESNPALSRATLVTRLSHDYYQALATCAYWILNNRVPEYVAPKDDQTYIQTWHGTPLKQLGFDVKEEKGGALNSARELALRFQMDSEKWSYLLSPSSYTSEHLCDAFGVEAARRDEIVIEEGYPRNDQIVNVLQSSDSSNQVAQMKEEIGIPRGKKVLLYAPTWRDNQFEEGSGYTFALPLDLAILREKLGDDWVVLMRLHYYISNRIDLSEYRGFVIDASSHDEINDLYCMADALCTDYSSVFFDYAVTGRPLYFFWNDREQYEKEMHGFYLDPESLPGPKCSTTEELADSLLEADEWHETYGAEYKLFRQTFCAKEDGNSAVRVLDKLIKH